MVRPRRTVWGDTRFNTSIATSIVSLSTLVGDFTITDTGGLTLTRTIVDLSLTTVPPPSADALGRLALGIGVASQEAFALGVTAIPDVESQTGHPPQDWVIRTHLGVNQNNTNVLPPVRFYADVRAQRKIDGSELYLVMRNDTLVGTAFSVHVVGLIRCLFLLP